MGLFWNKIEDKSIFDGEGGVNLDAIFEHIRTDNIVANSDQPLSVVIKEEALDLSNLDSGDGDASYKPKDFIEYIGQDSIKKRVLSYLEGCKKHNEIFPHTFISSPAGCFKENTKILMYDYSLKNIQDIEIGDVILGYDEFPKTKLGTRSFKPTVVTNLHKRDCDTMVYLKSDQNEIWTTNDHPFFMYYKTGQRNKFMQAGQINAQHQCLNFPQHIINNDYKLGWLIGFLMADGSICGQKLHFYNKDKFILTRITNYLKDLYDVQPKHIVKENGTTQISLSNKLLSNLYANMIDNLINKKDIYTKDIYRGMIGGFFDGDGTVKKHRGSPQHVILINRNIEYIKLLDFILNILSFETRTQIKHVEKRQIKNTKYFTKEGEIYYLHVYDIQNFYCTFIPSPNKIYYTKISGTQQFQKIRVKKTFRKQDFGKRMDFTVYNLTTDCSTYIANGFPVHNCGKTIFSNILADMLGKKFVTCTAGEIKSEQQLVDKIVECEAGVLFLDEAHRISTKIGTFLLPILEENKIAGKNIKPFTMICATTHKGNLSENLSALLQRFDLSLNLENYNHEELTKIFKQFKNKQYPKEKINDNVYMEIAENCRFTPRIGLHLLREYIYINDIQQVKNNNNIIQNGLTKNDIKILRYIFAHGGASKAVLAKYLRVEPKTYEFEYEPFLMFKELITIASKRQITEKGKELLTKLKEI